MPGMGLRVLFRSQGWLASSSFKIHPCTSVNSSLMDLQASRPGYLTGFPRHSWHSLSEFLLPGTLHQADSVIPSWTKRKRIHWCYRFWIDEYKVFSLKMNIKFLSAEFKYGIFHSLPVILFCALDQILVVIKHMLINLFIFSFWGDFLN